MKPCFESAGHNLKKSKFKILALKLVPATVLCHLVVRVGYGHMKKTKPKKLIHAPFPKRVQALKPGEELHWQELGRVTPHERNLKKHSHLNSVSGKVPTWQNNTGLFF